VDVSLKYLTSAKKHELDFRKELGVISIKAGKWSILRKAIPFVVLVLALRFALQNFFNLQVDLKFSDIAAIVTATSLIVALMLSGVLADYKESERIPGNLGRALTNLEGLAWRGLDLAGQDGQWARLRVLAIAEAIHGWLTQTIDAEDMWKAQRDGSNIILDVEKAGAPSHYAKRMLEINSELGANLSRVQVIRDTSYIQPGYALMELLIGFLMVLMAVVQFPAPYIEWPIAGALTLLYVFLLFLIKDVDDPFEYDADGKNMSAADVDLTPFLYALNRMRTEISARLDYADRD
jgi:hypothetical protein